MQHMELGIGTYSLPWAVGVAGWMPPQPLDALALLQLAVAHGLRHVQFGDNMPLHLLPDTELQAIRLFARQYHLQLEVGTRGLEAGNIRVYLEIASQLESPFLRVVIDDVDFHPSEAEVITVIRGLLPLLGEKAIILAIENHDRFPAASLERIIRQTSDRWVGICLDTANSLGAGEGIDTVLRVLAPYTVNLHIKDIRIQRVSHKMGFTVEGCPAGAGMLPIPDILAAVGQEGRCRSATLELWPDPEATIGATLEKERAWLVQSINYLKNIPQ